jgi:hypothetical protein
VNAALEHVSPRAAGRLGDYVAIARPDQVALTFVSVPQLERLTDPHFIELDWE